MANVQDVAKKAGVGVGTVSRVISGKGYVSEEKRKLVQAAIEELGYQPNELARNLLHNRTNIIAIIVPSVANAFYSTLVYYIEIELRKYGYKTMLCDTVGEKTNEQVFLEMLDRSMVDGVLTASHTQEHSVYKKLKKAVVSFDTPQLADGIPVITVDHVKGGRMAAEALIASDCREVLQFVDESDEDYPFIRRHREFRRVIEQAGIICHDYVLKWNEFGRDYAKFVAKDALEKYPQVDGVFSTDDHALDYMNEVRYLGKRIPEDVRVVAYDGAYILDGAYPPVSVVVQPIEEIALAGVNTLLKMIQENQPVADWIQLDVAYRGGQTTL
ncbi:MAG: LacI family DNA-binding transcriptional regulator [Lachnospiraceae bacterium]|nr:LacI family DNA-binding transcriptional regulator [Lachnospiraceae bacterium]